VDHGARFFLPTGIKVLCGPSLAMNGLKRSLDERDNFAHLGRAYVKLLFLEAQECSETWFLRVFV
jgi:hypothetical protein